MPSLASGAKYLRNYDAVSRIQITRAFAEITAKLQRKADTGS
ncbi:MAG: hypothetical protein ACM3WP_15030 [Acidobacteriota bacterium]